MNYLHFVSYLSGLAYAAVAKGIFVPNAASKTLSFVDPNKDMVIGHCETGPTGWLACLTPDGKYVVLTPYGSNIITIVDAGTGLKLRDIAVGSGNHVGHIVFSADSKKAYATNASDGALYVIYMQTKEVVKGIPTGDKAAQVINTYTNLFEVPGVYKHAH